MSQWLTSPEQKKSGGAALLAAVKDAQIPDAKLLIDGGASLEEKDYAGRTPLILAVFWEYGVFVPMLITAGAQLDQRDVEGNTALMLAVRARQTSTIRQLVAAGASLDIKNNAGQMAIDIAVEIRLPNFIDVIHAASVEHAQKVREKMAEIDQRAHAGTDAPRESAPMPQIKKRSFNPPG